MFNEKNESLFFKAWLRLIFAYLISFALSFAFGIFMTKIIRVAPETVFELSTKRLSYIVPIFETGEKLGVNQGIILFAWNTLGSVLLISFLYTARLFNPRNIELFPRALRRAFTGRKRMKLLCYLPGCMQIKGEPVRRLYVWLMVPWLGMILLGIESGLTVSTSSYTLGSYFIGFVSLFPHGIIEIPTIAFAGAVAFTGHLLVKERTGQGLEDHVFENMGGYTDEVPLANIITAVMLGLLVAGLIEGHITQGLVKTLIK